MITDIPAISQKELEKLWGYGFVDIQPIEHTSDTSEKLSKYMAKGVTDSRLHGLSKYSKSRNLCKPVIHYDEEVELLIEAFNLPN